MKRYTTLTLVCALLLTGCNKTQQPAQKPSSNKGTAATQQPPATPSAAKAVPASQPSKAEPAGLTAEALLAMIGKASRIEAKTAAGEKPSWSKDLTPADITNLKAGIGQAKMSKFPPRCLPTVMVTLYLQEKTLAKLGAYCDRGSHSALLRYDVNGALGSLVPQDMAKINAALESPVDR